MTLYRALKEGEVIDLGTGALENGIFIPFCINHVSIGVKYDPEGYYHTLVVRVEPPAFEEVETEACKMWNGSANGQDDSRTIHKATLKLMGFTEGE